MTIADCLPIVAQYRAGIEAEMALLRRLQAIAAREREVAASPAPAELEAIGDERDAVMASLVSIESELKPLRDTLLAHRTTLAGVPAFVEVAALHDEAAQLVADILSADEGSLAALKQAESTRRFAAQALDKGETTLAAYRRVLAPKLAQATLVNKRG